MRKASLRFTLNHMLLERYVTSSQPYLWPFCVCLFADIVFILFLLTFTFEDLFLRASCMFLVVPINVKYIILKKFSKFLNGVEWKKKAILPKFLPNSYRAHPALKIIC